MPRRSVYLLVIGLYACSLVVRLPSFDRPLSRHHESNAATALTVVEAWMQRGGMVQFCAVPFLNYANPGDRVLENDVVNDGKGNRIYLSYAPGMFVVPYLFFAFLRLPPSPAYLECINLLFLLASVLLLCRLLLLVFDRLPARHNLAVLGCAFFLFSPCLLWFCGNGYVNVPLSLPFLIGAFHEALVILHRRNVRPGRHYAALILHIFAGVYMDWDMVFVAAVIALLGVTGAGWKKIPGLSWLAAGTCLAAISLVVLQYSGYLSLHQIEAYWTNRLHIRSVDDTGVRLTRKILMLAENIALGYLPVLLFTAWILTPGKKKPYASISPIIKNLLILSGLSCLLYNLVFFNWSYIHDFAWVPFSIFFSVLPAGILSQNENFPRLKWLVAACLLLSVAQYYLINRPGAVSINGTRYDEYKEPGEQIRVLAHPAELIFMKEPHPITSWYSKRYFFQADSKTEAVKLMEKWKAKNGRWIEVVPGLPVHSELIRL